MDLRINSPARPSEDVYCLYEHSELGKMGNSSRRPTRRSTGDVSETTPLLARPANTPSPRCRRPADHSQHGEGSAGRFYTHPASGRGQTTFQLRLRQEYFDPGPADAWWTSHKALDSDCRSGEQQAITQEQTRQDWLQRLRPKPHRQSSPPKRGKENRPA